MTSSIDSIEILGPNFSNFVRSVMLVCEKKQIPYTTGMIFNKEEIKLKSEAHLKLHPFGKVPVIKHNDITLYETAPILRYLDAIASTPKLQPEGLVEQAKCDQLCAAISIYIDKAILRDVLIEFAFPKGENASVRLDRVEQKMPAAIDALTIMSNQLGSKQFLLGDTFTLADALFVPILDYTDRILIAQNALGDFPNLVNYLNYIRATPEGKKVLTQPELSF